MAGGGGWRATPALSGSRSTLAPPPGACERALGRRRDVCLSGQVRLGARHPQHVHKSRAGLPPGCQYPAGEPSLTRSGTWPRAVKHADDGTHFTVDDQKISFSDKEDFTQVDWKSMGVQIVIDCTGKFLTARPHLPPPRARSTRPASPSVALLSRPCAVATAGGGTAAVPGRLWRAAGGRLGADSRGKGPSILSDGATPSCPLGAS